MWKDIFYHEQKKNYMKELYSEVRECIQKTVKAHDEKLIFNYASKNGAIRPSYPNRKGKIMLVPLDDAHYMKISLSGERYVIPIVYEKQGQEDIENGKPINHMLTRDSASYYQELFMRWWKILDDTLKDDHLELSRHDWEQ
ncbi:hypothetical protein EPN87_03000 [archaeon]|nr:MAG: hypothetical protein EPN87_03000 [archaeon]